MLPWLNYLAILRQPSVMMGHRILNANMRDWRPQKRHKKLHRFKHSLAAGRVKPQMLYPGVAKEGAGGMSYHKLPAKTYHLQHIALYMISRFLAWQQIATPGIVP